MHLAGYHGQATGAIGDKTLVYLNVTAVGKAGAKTTVEVAVITLSDVLGDNVPSTVKAGTVTVK